MKRLGVCEPVLCAPMALKALIPPGKRQHVKSELLKLFEFNSGRDPNGDITEDLQDEAMMDSSLEEDTSRRGHRMARVPLPPDYNKHGVYQWIPRTHTLKHSYTKEEVELDQKTVDEMGDVFKATIYSNWSETNACLKVPGTRVNIRLGQLFPDQFPSRSSPSKPPQTTPPLPRNGNSTASLTPSPTAAPSSEAGVMVPLPPLGQ